MLRNTCPYVRIRACDLGNGLRESDTAHVESMFGRPQGLHTHMCCSCVCVLRGSGKKCLYMSTCLTKVEVFLHSSRSHIFSHLPVAYIISVCACVLVCV